MDVTHISVSVVHTLTDILDKQQATETEKPNSGRHYTESGTVD